MSVLARLERIRVQYFYIGIGTGVEMAAFALHENAARLLRHAVVIADFSNAAGFGKAALELFVRNLLILQLFPAAAVDQIAIGQIRNRMLLACRLFFLSHQGFVEVRPDHEGESESESRSLLRQLCKGFERLPVQLHVFVQGVIAP